MSKIKLCLVTFGIIIGIVGILHGCAELLKGNILIEDHSVKAMPDNWPNKEFFTIMKGAPVFSILTGIPHYVLGLLAISVSILLIVVSATYLEVTNTGLIVFALLSVGIFLFGAGEGTPFAISLPMIVAGTLALKKPQKVQRTSQTLKKIRFSFSLFYWLHIFSWVLFFPGLFVMSFYQQIPKALFLFDFMIMPISVLGALVSAFMYDRTAELNK